MDHKFQINLRGIIDLLSNHLYSGPEVFIRELLQNGVDAIRARGEIEPGHGGELTIEVHAAPGKRPALVVSDDGIGLSVEEVHRFLATIGETSKRADLWDRRVDFIGQFGIGLLSCFVVSEEIVVVTRSARGGSGALEWRGRSDGTYAIKPLGIDLAPGTQVFLTCKEGSEALFEVDRVRALARHFGRLLPVPIRVTAGPRSDVINADPVPWRRPGGNPQQRTRALLDFGRELFAQEFFDAVPLRSSAGAVEGVAFILPYTPSLAARRAHRVYLKNMLLSEAADNLLPDWAFFVQAVVNADDLRPTASRESFYEDARLEAARAALGECLRHYLIELSRADTDKFKRLIRLHHLSIKALAVEDPECYQVFMNWLPFETTQGEMTLAEYLQHHDVIRYVGDDDQFRQLAGVAAAQGLCIVNGGHVYHAELLARYPEVFPDVPVEVIDPASVAQTFEDLSPQEEDEAQALLALADETLRPFQCRAEVKKFAPPELATLYSADRQGRFLRSLEQARETANPLWSGVLDNLARRERSSQPAARLYFNYNNALVRRLAGVRDRRLLQRSVQLLYVQALLLGHHPLNAREMRLLNDGLLDLVAWGVKSQEGEAR